MAPIVMLLPSVVIPLNCGRLPRSISAEGAASRSFMAGISVMPPASGLASALATSDAPAAPTLEGRIYSKVCMIGRSRGLVDYGTAVDCDAGLVAPPASAMIRHTRCGDAGMST